MSDQRKNNRDVTKAIIALLAAGEFGYVLGLRLAGFLLLLRPAPSPEAAHWLAMKVANLPRGNLPSPFVGADEMAPVPDGPAQKIEREHAPAWFALYLVAAAGRLALPTRVNTEEEAMATEERFFQLALDAEERRMRAAALQDMNALLNVDRSEDTKGLLGWRAVIDNRTTPECRAANGRNFKADRMPAIGWPGAVHIHCRCTAGPPVPGAPLLPSV